MKKVLINEKEVLFTSREESIIDGLLDYKFLGEISRDLGISARTISVQLSKIKEKAGIYNKSTLLNICKKQWGENEK